MSCNYSGPVVTLLEQGVFAGSNFVFVLLLGRLLPPDGYGALSIGLAVFLLQAGVFTALVLEPLPVLGYVSPEKASAVYMPFFQRAGLTVSIVAASVVLGAAFLAAGQTRDALLATALASPLILLYWSRRWLCYALGAPALAARHTLTYAATLMAGLAFGWAAGWRTAWTFLLCMGVAGWIASLATGQSTLRSGAAWGKDSNHELGRQHWLYGRWILAASLCYWVTLQVHYLVVGALVSVEAAGGLRAMQNLAQPLEQVSTALGLWMLPRIAQRVRVGELDRAGRALRRMTRALTLAGVLYLAACWLTAKPLVFALYGGQFLEFVWLVPVLVAVPLCMALSRGAQLATRALQRPRLLLGAYAGSAAASAILGPLLVCLAGAAGAAFAMLLASATFTVVLGFLVTREAAWLRGA